MPAFTWVPGEATVVAALEFGKAACELMKVVHEKTPATQLEAQAKLVVEMLKGPTALAELVNNALGINKENVNAPNP
jgi:hypothetical protein